MNIRVDLKEDWLCDQNTAAQCVCTICDHVMVGSTYRPTLLLDANGSSCGHVFCCNCVGNETPKTKTCPSCKRENIKSTQCAFERIDLINGKTAKCGQCSATHLTLGSQWQEHRDKSCPERQTTCADCRSVMLAKEQPAHVCLLPCPWPGCPDKIARNDQKQHDERAKDQHLVLLKKAYDRQSDELAIMSKRLSSAVEPHSSKPVARDANNQQQDVSDKKVILSVHTEYKGPAIEDVLGYAPTYSLYAPQPLKVLVMNQLVICHDKDGFPWPGRVIKTDEREHGRGRVRFLRFGAEDDHEFASHGHFGEPYVYAIGERTCSDRQPIITGNRIQTDRDWEEWVARRNPGDKIDVFLSQHQLSASLGKAVGKNINHWVTGQVVGVTATTWSFRLLRVPCGCSSASSIPFVCRCLAGEETGVLTFSDFSGRVMPYGAVTGIPDCKIVPFADSNGR